MKKSLSVLKKGISRLKAFAGAAVFVLWAAGAATPARAEVIERILAVVNDEIVTEADLESAMAPVASQLRAIHSGQDLEDKLAKAREDFLRKMIEDKLILSEAKRRKMVVADSEVDDMIADVRNKFPSREMFLKAIEEQGITERKLWDRFRDQLMTQKLVAQEVRSKVSVSPGEVNAYYKQHPERFSQGERVRLEQILIREGPRSDEEARQFVESLEAKLREGATFADLARQYSEGSEAKEGGAMGWVERGQLLGEIDEKVFLLQAAQMTPPIRTSLGYHLFRVAQREASSTKPLADVKDEIQEILFKEKLRMRLDAWIESLKKNAYISIR